MSLTALELTSIGLSVGTAFAYAFIFAILLKRKLRSDFPVFLIYAAVNTASNLFLSAFTLARGGSSHLYYYSWWALYVLLMLLEFGILYEIFSYALKPYSGLVDLGKLLFRWAGIFLLILAGLTAFSTAGSGMTKCIAAIALVERNLRLMQCGLLLLFFLFERRLALSWRSYPVSLALGLGLFAALSLSGSFITLHIRALVNVFGMAASVATFAIAAFWAHCFVRRQPGVQTVLDSPSKLIFQRWNEAILSTQPVEDKNPALATVDSFLPGIEKTVERVLARKIAN